MRITISTGFLENKQFRARSNLPRQLASKAQKYRKMAANMADPDDVQLILDFAASLEKLSKCECDITGFFSDQDLDPDRERLRYILNGVYSKPMVAPLMLEIMFSEVLQK